MVQRLPSDSTYPLLIGLVFAWWLGNPWIKRSSVGSPSAPLLIFGMLLIAAGLIGERLFPAALGWTLLLAAWIRVYFKPAMSLSAWSMIPLFSFPWIAADLSSLGWYFRLSGAWASEKLFAALGFSIHRDGTLLDIQGLPIAIEPACGGMNLLPALMLTGTAVGFLFLRGQARFWFFLALLFPLAWLANTIRICVISAVGLTWGASFASGFFHTWGALIVLGVMFGACVGLAQCLQKFSKANPA